MNHGGHRLSLLLDQCALFFALTAVILYPLICGPAAGDAVRLILLMLDVFAIVLWLVARFLAPVFQWRVTGLEVPALLWVGYLVLNIFRADYMMDGLRLSFVWIASVLLFLVLVQMHLALPWARRVVTSALVATLAVCGLYAVCQYTVFLPALRTLHQKDAASVMAAAQISTEYFALWSSRLSTQRAFGAFLTSNILAGFFVLFLPWLSAMFLAELRHKPVQKTALAGLAIAWCLAAWGLVLTFSRGGFVALGFGCAFLAWQWKKTLTDYGKRLFWLGSGLLACVITGGGFLLYEHSVLLAGAGRSLGVRMGYWQGALRVIQQAGHALLGVGTGQYGSFYFQYKLAGAGQSHHAHNDYLQICVEWGLIGFVLLLVVVVLAIKKGSQSPTDVKQDHSEKALPSGTWLLILGAVAAFVMRAILLATDFPQWNIVFFLVWILVALSVYHSRGMLHGPLVRQGWLAGFAAFGVHIFVEFDLYSPGLLHTFWIGLGLVVASGMHQAKLISYTLRPPVRIACFLVLIVGMFCFVWWPSQRLVMAKTMEQEADFAVQEGRLLDAADYFRKAIIANPFEAVSYEKLAGLYRAFALAQAGRQIEAEKTIQTLLYTRIRDRGTFQRNLFRVSGESRSYFVLEQETLTRACEVRPRSSQLRKMLSDHYRLRSMCGDPQLINQAVIDAQKAMNLNPTDPRAHKHLAYLYEQQGDPAQAAASWQRYLDLGALAWERHLQPNEDEIQQVRARIKLLDRAHGAFEESSSPLQSH